jgi:hypothetical protein
MNVQDKIKQLNQHPLNQLALKRLRSAGHTGDPQLLHLVSLAHLGISQDGEPDPLSPEAKTLSDWGQGHLLQQEAMKHLEQSVSPNDVEHANLDNVADQVVRTLQGASR